MWIWIILRDSVNITIYNNIITNDVDDVYDNANNYHNIFFNGIPIQIMYQICFFLV